MEFNGNILVNKGAPKGKVVVNKKDKERKGRLGQLNNNINIP